MYMPLLDKSSLPLSLGRTDAAAVAAGAFCAAHQIAGSECEELASIMSRAQTLVVRRMASGVPKKPSSPSTLWLGGPDTQTAVADRVAGVPCSCGDTLEGLSREVLRPRRGDGPTERAHVAAMVDRWSLRDNDSPPPQVLLHLELAQCRSLSVTHTLNSIG